MSTWPTVSGEAWRGGRRPPARASGNGGSGPTAPPRVEGCSRGSANADALEELPDEGLQEDVGHPSE
eukprot:14242539-Alexandrium_andersonii.AAC.1